MYCRKCGAQIREGAAFCQACGEPVPQTGTGNGPAGPKRKVPVKLIVAVAVAAVVVVGAVFGVSTLLSGRGYSSSDKALEQLEKGLTTLYNAEEESDVKKASNQIIKAMPSKAVKALNEERDYDDDENAFVDQISYGSYDNGDMLDDIEDLIEEVCDYYDIDEDEFELSFELERGDRLDSDDIDDIEDYLDEIDVDMEIDSAYEIDATIIVTYTDDDDTEEESMGTLYPLILIKVDNTWYVWFEYLSL